MTQSNSIHSSFLKTGEIVPETAAYRVHDRQHRLPSEIALVFGSKFPRGSSCDAAAKFEPIPWVGDSADLREQTTTIQQLDELTDEAPSD